MQNLIHYESTNCKTHSHLSLVVLIFCEKVHPYIHLNLQGYHHDQTSLNLHPYIIQLFFHFIQDYTNLQHLLAIFNPHHFQGMHLGLIPFIFQLVINHIFIAILKIIQSLFDFNRINLPFFYTSL